MSEVKEKNVRELSRMVRETWNDEQKDVVTQIVDLPVGKEFNDGSGERFWRKQGWVPYTEYQAQKKLAELEELKAEVGDGSKAAADKKPKAVK